MFLIQILHLQQSQAFQVAQAFLTPVQTYGAHRSVIDLDAFEKRLYQQPGLLAADAFTQRNAGLVTIQRIYDEMRKYILVQGGDIMRFFTEVDANHDNFLTKVELQTALQRIGFVGANQLSEVEATNVFMYFDVNKDGRISYSELCQ